MLKDQPSEPWVWCCVCLGKGAKQAIAGKEQQRNDDDDNDDRQRKNN